MKTLLQLFLRLYQLALSPYLGQNCRFYPSCSAYAMEAIGRHGAARGTLLAGRRLCKCHPWHAGGVDPVPPLAGQAPSPAVLPSSLQPPAAAGNTDFSFRQIAD